MTEGKQLRDFIYISDLVDAMLLISESQNYNGEIFNICRTFSLENKNQQKNLIETIKQNCKRIVREKTGKKPFKISKVSIVRARNLLPERKIFVAPGFFEP